MQKQNGSHAAGSTAYLRLPESDAVLFFDGPDYQAGREGDAELHCLQLRIAQAMGHCRIRTSDVHEPDVANASRGIARRDGSVC